ncbi:MAG: GNAT family N-acetyltransferase [Gammaproteobacteria bacterium]
MHIANPKLSGGLSIRPSNPGDTPFLETLYHSTRDDLRLADADDDYIEEIIAMQFRAQSSGYGEQFPNAMYFVVEHLGERIGKLTLDFGTVEVRVVDLALVREARGKGIGAQVIQAVQQTAQQIMAPVTLSVAVNNVQAQQLYQRMGFQLQESTPVTHHLVWFPSRPTV